MLHPGTDLGERVSGDSQIKNGGGAVIGIE